jgi:phosphoribosylanthranilate isomerase
MSDKIFPQIKICGLTSVALAVRCADLGVQAIGCVFYPKSPRHVADETARAICRAVKGRVQTVGVFVNESFDTILQKVTDCGITVVQLHGEESPDLVRRLRGEKIPVVKALFSNRYPDFAAAALFDASAFLVECSGGTLPGGNAKTWDWAEAKPFAERHPCILAGGLTAENIASAIGQAMPRAVDVSSGVESAPGIKSMEKVTRFVENIKALGLSDPAPDATPIF